MKQNEIEKGGVYRAKVSERIVDVRVDEIAPGPRYAVTNLKTGRRLTFRSAQKFRSRVEQKAGA